MLGKKKAAPIPTSDKEKEGKGSKCFSQLGNPADIRIYGDRFVNGDHGDIYLQQYF